MSKTVIRGLSVFILLLALSSDVNVDAIIGTSKIQPTGSYSVDVTMIAVTLDTSITVLY